MTVSVIIPTYNRTALLTERALPSVLGQTYRDLEVLVVGDGTEQATVDAMAAVKDRRVQFTNLPHYPYPADRHRHWALLGYAARNWGLDHASGEYIVMLDDDDSMEPDAIRRLPTTLRAKRVDFVYGISHVYRLRASVPSGIGLSYRDAQGPWENGTSRGSWPPGGGAFCNGAFLYRASLNYRFDFDCYSVYDDARDAALWTRMVRDGVKFHFLPEHVHNYYRSNWL